MTPLDGFFFLGAPIALLLAFLVTGRVPLARTFTRFYSADRRDTPALYWFFVLAWAAVTATCAWDMALAKKLDALLPGIRETVEQAAPYVAMLILVAYVVTAYASERRRRARLRAQHPSAVERASGGV